MNKKIEFAEVIASVPVENQSFIENLHHELIALGCTIDIKLAKSGYMVAYLYEKKTIANYVFRKKGMFVRIYGVHVKAYESLLNTLPDDMIIAIEASQVCKRLVDSTACNPKCSMGYEFHLKGNHYQKCRNGAFMFLICPDHHSYIHSFLVNEVNACKEGNI